MKGTSTTLASRAVWLLTGLHWPAILRHWLRQALLKFVPNSVAHHLLFAPKSAIPKSQHSDSAAFEPCITFGIFRALFGHAVTASIQFDVQHRFDTKKIERVW